MAGHEWNDWFEREEFIGQISDIRVQNLQVEREVVQKRTFTRWMNLHLEKCNPPLEVRDLFRDIQDGRLLMALLEELSGCKLLQGFKPSSHRIFRLNNIAKVLAFLEERNVKLVSIDAADVADGNSSIILGLIWNIILFFQIKELTGNIRSQFPSTSSISSLPNSSDSDTSLSSTPSDERQASIAIRDHGKPIRTLLQWVQRRTRKYGVAVQDFGKSWTSGLAFLAVIKSIDSTLVDMRRAILRSSRENLEEAFRTAHYSLGIPRLLEPEDVTINSPDEQSIMTYVSQFLEHFPGFEEEEMSNAIERNISSDKVNGVRGKTKKPFVVGSKWVQPPPKIFISSISEDKDQPCSPLQTPGLEESSDSVFSPVDEPQKRPQDLGKEVSFTVSSSSSPQPSFVDSVIDSPDSWSDITSEAVPPDKMVESQSDGSLNENELPFDQRDWLPKPPKREHEAPEENGKATEDQVLTELFIDEGNFSESSTESFQTKPKIPSEEEDAYQYIMGLNEEETAEPSLPGNPNQMIDRFGSMSEKMEETRVAQNDEGGDFLHKVEAHTTLSQDNITDPSTELSGPETDDSHSKNDDRLEAALKCEDTSTSQNHDVDKRSSPDFSREKNVTDEFSEEQEVSASQKSEANFKQPFPEIRVELEESLPSEFEENENDNIPADSMIQNPGEDKEPSGMEKNPTDEAPILNSTCDPESTVLANSQPSEMIVCAPDTSRPVDADLRILESDDETNKYWSNDNTSCAPVEDKHRDRDHREPDNTNEIEDVTVAPLEPDSITPEAVETLIDLPPKAAAEEEDQCPPHSPSDPQNSPKEVEGPTYECTDDHAYLSWTARPDSGDDMSDTGEEDDERGCTTGPESRLVGLDDTDSALEFKPAPAEERSLDSEECLAENSEYASPEKGRQEGLDAGSQMPCLNERLGDVMGDSGGAEPDMPSQLYKLIKADEGPVVASENTETLRGKHENEVSTSERHFSEGIDSDGLKIKSKKISESSNPNINSALRRESQSPVTCGVTKDELYWLLFLWFALYCFFVLPQMDMKTLPYLLLNLEE